MSTIIRDNPRPTSSGSCVFAAHLPGTPYSCTRTLYVLYSVSYYSINTTYCVCLVARVVHLSTVALDSFQSCFYSNLLVHVPGCVLSASSFFSFFDVSTAVSQTFLPFQLPNIQKWSSSGVEGLGEQRRPTANQPATKRTVSLCSRCALGQSCTVACNHAAHLLTLGLPFGLPNIA